MLKRMYKGVKNFVGFNNINLYLIIVSSGAVALQIYNPEIINPKMLASAVAAIGSLEHMRLKYRFRRRLEDTLKKEGRFLNLEKIERASEYLTEHYLKGFSEQQILSLCGE